MKPVTTGAPPPPLEIQRRGWGPPTHNGDREDVGEALGPGRHCMYGVACLLRAQGLPLEMHK